MVNNVVKGVNSDPWFLLLGLMIVRSRLRLRDPMAVNCFVCVCVLEQNQVFENLSLPFSALCSDVYGRVFVATIPRFS